MSFIIVRNDITEMKTEAIVNTANSEPVVGSGCDMAIYRKAGYDRLLQYRIDKIGHVDAGEAFITPGFDLPAKYIIHTVSPMYKGGTEGENEKLRDCYRNVLRIAAENKIQSLAIPLIATGNFGYPREEGMRIAADEIREFLTRNNMTVYLVVFDDLSVKAGRNLCPDLDEYIDRNYVDKKSEEEYDRSSIRAFLKEKSEKNKSVLKERSTNKFALGAINACKPADFRIPSRAERMKQAEAREDVSDETVYSEHMEAVCMESSEELDFEDFHAKKLEERMKHLTDTFSEYLLYLIKDKNMDNADVYKRAVVDKKTFSKMKNNVNYHPQKITALCLCIGACLNLDETKDLLARAGYALSPCDKTDIIFSYFIENEIYDMIELDIQLEEHGLPCVIE